VYLSPTGASGEQALEGVIYADGAGQPQALLAVSEQLSFKSANAAGWYDLPFAASVKLAAGSYWIGVITGGASNVAGFRYDSVAGSRDYNANAYASGPSNPFGSPTVDGEQASLYATYAGEGSAVPVNTSPPAISGSAQQGQLLSEHNGSWTNSPTGFAYQWLQCDALGNGCLPIAGATGQSYVPVAGDVEHTLKVQETASNEAGPGAPASSAASAKVAPSPSAGTFGKTAIGASSDTFAANRKRVSAYALRGGDTTPPSQPQGLHATAIGPGQINLSWSAAGDDVGVSGYTIRRNGAVITNTASSATGYSDNGRAAGTTYSYTVDAYDAAGNHSAQSAGAGATTLSSAGVQHYEYVFPANAIDVYDMDNGQKLLKTIPLPAGATDIRGAAASPVSHILYVSYGSDSGANGGGTMLAYDLLGEKVLWTHAYPEGIDSMAITPDGRTIYMPVGEASSASNWNVLDAATGNITGRIEGGSGPHNTVVSLNGEHVYMGGREASFLTEADTQSNRLIKQIGPLLSSTVRPFTINGGETFAFTTATGYLGFQVSSIATGQVLYTVPVSGPFPYTPGQAGPSSPSHGISLSPDEKELWLVDQPNSYVHVFDIGGLPGAAPKQVADIKTTRSMTGSQVGCTYDCLREGWLQHSLDGRFVYVGDSGDVIDTGTRQSVANLEPLYNSRVYLEIDWSGGVPVATSTRAGLGYITP
jgi:hypothetical protein